MHIPATTTGPYTAAEIRRHARAERASLRSLLRPRSIALIGPGRRPQSIGVAVLGQVRASGSAGPVYLVRPSLPHRPEPSTYRGIDELPTTVDLAVVCVPADAVPSMVEACGQRGILPVVVVSSGISERPVLADMVTRYGIRLVGPNCLGIANTDPTVALSARFLRQTPRARSGSPLNRAGSPWY